MTFTLLNASLWAVMAALNPCNASMSPVGLDGQTVDVIGTLIFSQHSSHLIETSAIDKTEGCMVYVEFGDHELLFAPGGTREYIRDPNLRKFVVSYRSYLKANPARPKAFRVTGRLRVKNDFKMVRAGHWNGYGYHGLFRTAIVVQSVADLEPSRR